MLHVRCLLLIFSLHFWYPKQISLSRLFFWLQLLLVFTQLHKEWLVWFCNRELLFNFLKTLFKCQILCSHQVAYQQRGGPRFPRKASSDHNLPIYENSLSFCWRVEMSLNFLIDPVKMEADFFIWTILDLQKLIINARASICCFHLNARYHQSNFLLQKLTLA